jgi:hypothetical protein
MPDDPKAKPASQLIPLQARRLLFLVKHPIQPHGQFR